MDPPVSRLNKATMMPVEESPSFKDLVNRKVELVTCIMFIVASLALQLVLAMTLVSQTLTDWLSSFSIAWVGSKFF